jgi:hypothetical protein
LSIWLSERVGVETLLEVVQAVCEQTWLAQPLAVAVRQKHHFQ